MSDVNLDLLIGEVDRRSDTTDEVDRVATAAKLAGELEAMASDLVEHFVELARNESRSWADIGDALGVSRQAAAQRFVAPAKELAVPLGSDVEAAFVATKEAAIAYRHNYIGTEHLLLGLLAHDNAATKALKKLGADPSTVIAGVKDRMSLGGSQAAARIPWTPYARKVADLAEQAAQARGHAEVDTLDWLDGLLELGRGIACEVLAATGITSTKTGK